MLLVKLLLILPPEGFKSSIPHDLTCRRSARKLTSEIIHNLIARNIFFYICTFEKIINNKQMALLVQYKLIKKVDCIS